MHARPDIHPSTDILEAFAHAKLADSCVADTVVQHLETCAHCREKLASFSDDRFLRRLREARSASDATIPTHEIPNMARAMNELESGASIAQYLDRVKMEITNLREVATGVPNQRSLDAALKELDKAIATRNSSNTKEGASRK